MPCGNANYCCWFTNQKKRLWETTSNPSGLSRGKKASAEVACSEAPHFKKGGEGEKEHE